MKDFDLVNRQNLFLIVGRSGSGKDSIINYLCHKYKMQSLKSYTTRPKRYDKENTHTFITEEEYDKLEDIVADTIFCGYKYCATRNQVDKSNFYIIDVDGIKAIKEKYKGDKNLIVIYLDCSREISAERMRKRGHSEEEIDRRVKFDDMAFKDAIKYADYIVNVNNGSVEENAKKVLNCIKE